MSDRPLPEFHGTCECGWDGPLRYTQADARADTLDHCRESWCCDAGDFDGEFHDDDLMPHERRRLHR